MSETQQNQAQCPAKQHLVETASLADAFPEELQCWCLAEL